MGPVLDYLIPRMGSVCFWCLSRLSTGMPDTKSKRNRHSLMRLAGYSMLEPVRLSQQVCFTPVTHPI